MPPACQPQCLAAPTVCATTCVITPKITSDCLHSDFALKQTRTGYTSNNLVAPYDWSEGTGGTTNFSINGSAGENCRTWLAAPFGERALAWRAISDTTSGAEGGFVTSQFRVDPNKTYRFSVWTKRDSPYLSVTLLKIWGFKIGSIGSGFSPRA